MENGLLLKEVPVHIYVNLTMQTYDGRHSGCRKRGQTMTLSPPHATDFLTQFEINFFSTVLRRIYIVTNHIQFALVAKINLGPVVIRPRNMLFNEDKSSNLIFLLIRGLVDRARFFLNVHKYSNYEHVINVFIGK